MASSKRLLAFPVTLLLFTGCPPTDDFDGDGVPDSSDCEPQDPAVYPGGPEACDTIDSDCDGSILDDYSDLDSDGLPDCVDSDADGDTVDASADCDDLDAGLGSVAQDSDCDGTTSLEDCDDNDAASTTLLIDNDCDGYLNAEDCDDADPDSTSVAEDADCDGIPTGLDCDDENPTATSLAEDGDCDGVPSADDCDDEESASGSSVFDQDCDGTPTADDCDDTDLDSTVVAEDADCDGVLTTADCDDADSSLLALADDADCDGVPTVDDCDDGDATVGAQAQDADCDGALTADDCDDSDPGLLATAEDADCDGSLDPADCDDGSAATYPGAAEACDSIDSDCDGSLVDEFADLDGDGEPDCIDADVDGDLVLPPLDCAPADAAVYPGAAESCDATDSDCDGSLVDEFPDLDGDGDPDCTDPDADGDGVTGGSGDCDDTDPAVSPTATEAECDGIDNDCDPATADDVDADGDGALCSVDCDDSDSDNTPGAPELCDGQDNDCDSATFAPGGEGDADQDGAPLCADCDDLDPSIYPGAAETTCNGLDDDCDLVTPDDVDFDNDGVLCSVDCDDADSGLGDQSIDVDCDGYVPPVDCDNANSLVYPGSSERWESPGIGLDVNCDGDLWDGAQESFAAFIGAAPPQGSGSEVVGVADINGDGADELLIVAAAASTAYLVFGDLLLAPGTQSLSAADVTFAGFGYNPTVASLGDIDGDGAGDVLIGSAQVGPAGSAFLFYGSSLAGGGGFGPLDADAEFIGINAGDQLGASVSGPGDLNNDGYADLFIVASGYEDPVSLVPGEGYLFLGGPVPFSPPPTTVSVGTADLRVALSNGVMVGAPAVIPREPCDFDGDGIADLVFYSPTFEPVGVQPPNTGAALGFAGGSLSYPVVLGAGQADLVIATGLYDPSPTAGGIACIPSVDTDSASEIAFRQPGPGGLSSVGVFLSTTVAGSGSVVWSSADMFLVEENTGDWGGRVLGGVPDLDGDGLGELFVSARANDDGGNAAGKLYYLSGATLAAGGTISLADSDAAWIGEASQDIFGSSVSFAGDVNGDGFGDFVVGARGNQEGGAGTVADDAGKSYLFLGPMP